MISQKAVGLLKTEDDDDDDDSSHEWLEFLFSLTCKYFTVNIIMFMFCNRLSLSTGWVCRRGFSSNFNIIIIIRTTTVPITVELEVTVCITQLFLINTICFEYVGLRIVLGAKIT